MLVGFSTSEEPDVSGTWVARFVLDSNGELSDELDRVDVATPPIRIGFALGGRFAIVLGEDGQLVSLKVLDNDELVIIDRIDLPSYSYADMEISDVLSRIFPVAHDVTDDAGVDSVAIDCDGILTLHPEERFGIRLASSLSLGPSGKDALLLGGQVVFDPPDPNDIRHLIWGDSGWQEDGAFDVYASDVQATKIAISPDGSIALVPNNSSFSDEGNQISVLNVSGSDVTEAKRLTNLEEASFALWLHDGALGLVSRFFPGKVTVLGGASAQELEVVQTLSGIGLADQMAAVRTGELRDYVLVTSVDPSEGPSIGRLRRSGNTMEKLPQLLLGSGAANIPGAIAIRP